MKKVFSLFILFALSAHAYAQDKIKEGVVNFDITYPELSPEMKQMEGMLPKTMDVYFRSNQSRTEMNLGGGSTTSISDGTRKEVLVLMDMMGKKLALKQDANDLKKKEEEQKKAGQYPTDIKVIKSTERKMIAGYNCYKATITYKLNGQPERMDVFYTNDLPKSVNNMDNPALQAVEGFMMEYNLSQGGMKMRIKARSVMAQKVGDNMFSIPSGYKIVTLEELQQIMTGEPDK